MPRALLSVSDKTGIADLGRGLIARGFSLVSTGGTARALVDAGLPVTSVSDVTGFPEMLDGRVKTLHPAVHGGILARRDHPGDLQILARLGIQPIDVVVVNLYPFAETAAREGVEFDALIEQIDIGGPSLVRAAAKSFRDVLVVVDPGDYPRLLVAIDGEPGLAFRYELMRKAFAHTAEYDTAIAGSLAAIALEGDRFERCPPEGAFDRRIDVSWQKIRDLRYGENPHQRAAWYRRTDAARGAGPTVALGAATMLQGRELSYTNLLDLDTAARIVREFGEPAAAIIKHANPCGAAIGETAADAYVRAREADRTAAYGGIVGLNRAIDVATAEAIVKTFIEAVIAPEVDGPAREVLAGKSNMRVLTAEFEAPAMGELEFRSLPGAVLVQDGDRVTEARDRWTADGLPEGFRIATRRHPTAEEWEALRFAWRVCAHVKSNAVIFTDVHRTLAIGAGQTSRVDAVRLAVMKAGPASLSGSVAASDAFFPFRDGLDAVAKAGATAVVHPGGSVRDEEVIAAADEHGLAMVFTGRRHFRH
jgi:phosphoribosylaminoimidazolecarboxamide formyltransferase/IMP cyclohydrolase